MLKQQQNSAWQLTKLSIYAGLGLGAVCGTITASYVVWWQNHFIQKKLFSIVLNIFCQYVMLASIFFALACLVLYPCLHLMDLHMSRITKQGFARIVLMGCGLIALVGGYWLNRSSWFPAFASSQGMIGNALWMLVCLGLAVAIYKIFVHSVGQFPELRLGVVANLYSPKLFFALAFGHVLLIAGTAYWNSRNVPTGPNVVLITVDTLRADHLGCYGYDKNTSPTIDRLAREGVKFEYVFAQRGLTWPSLTSIMTSMYPKTHGVESNEMHLAPAFLTMPEILKDAGYKTAAFLTNYFHAPNRGFDVKKGGAVGDLDRQVTNLAVRWLEKQRGEKFFVWIHYKNPHMPYNPPEQFRDADILDYDGPYDGSWAKMDSVYTNKIDLSYRDLSHIIKLYDAEIKSTDSYIAEVLAKLDEMGISDNTFVIFSADHGEELYDHHYYFYHGCSIYDGVLRIPLLFRYPGVFQPGRVNDNLFESIDIAPTILQALKIPPGPEFEGRSFFHVLFAGQSNEWHQVFGERSRKIYVTRTPRWKFIYNPDNYLTNCVRSPADQGGGFPLATEELYDIANDPGENVNLAEQHPLVADSLRNQLLVWAESNKRQHVPQKLSKEAEERLRALGYIR